MKKPVAALIAKRMFKSAFLHPDLPGWGDRKMILVLVELII
jgi:hypothetical protein